MRVVVTGGAGFIGANLCRHLCADPSISQVVVFDDFSTGHRGHLDGLGVEVVEGTILDLEALGAVASGASAIVHLAARSSVPRSMCEPVPAHEVNATGTLNVLETARGVGGAHVVFASSSSVYGANPVLPKHEDLATRPVSPYAASKLAAESYTLAWQSSYDLPTLAFRFFNVFGPLQTKTHAYAAVVPAFMSAAIEGHPLPVHGDGTQSRDFTYVDTVCDVIADAVRRRITNPEPVNLAFGTRTSLLELINTLEELLGEHLEVAHLPPRAGDVPHTQASTERLRGLFPDVRPVELRTGLANTLAWARHHHADQPTFDPEGVVTEHGEANRQRIP
ncbi:MAG: NAD-dependent epimerase/dehydratase family protein [Microthrixaceae bacterium]|nr:NAD-dependent epimerase/dehydratase family protein [Microthrixaceae bacterium]